MLRLGQEEGLRYFIAKLGSPLRFFAYKIVKNKHAAEDIVSDCFVKLWNRRDQACSSQSVKVFLYLIVRNACYDYIGAQYQQKIVLMDDDVLLNEHEGYFDVLSEITYAELVVIISKEVEKLPSRQAEVFKMSYLDGLDTDEICEELKISASNVYFTKSKAISAIRKALSLKKY